MSEFVCLYCKKSFRKESTLAAHLCEQKRRWQQEKDIAVQMGLQAYLRFYEITQGSAQHKTYDDFASSPYYRAFVKFGRHCQGIRCVNFRSFTEWLLKNNKKLDHWCHDSFYHEWLLGYIKKESVQDALERSFKEMQKYADEHPDLASFAHYFRYANTNRVCHHISNGRISPWLVFNCDSGVEFLENLHEEQLNIIMPWIDPEYWERKFRDYLADTEWVKSILKESGL